MKIRITWVSCHKKPNGNLERYVHVCTLKEELPGCLVMKPNVNLERYVHVDIVENCLGVLS